MSVYNEWLLKYSISEVLSISFFFATLKNYNIFFPAPIHPLIEQSNNKVMHNKKKNYNPQQNTTLWRFGINYFRHQKSASNVSNIKFLPVVLAKIHLENNFNGFLSIIEGLIPKNRHFGYLMYILCSRVYQLYAQYDDIFWPFS